MSIIVRYACMADIPQINVLRRSVNELHVTGRPDFFRSDAWPVIEGRAAELLCSETDGILVALTDGEIAGFAVVNYIDRPENPYMRARRFYHVEEFGVAERFRRMGVATALVAFMKQDARERGFSRIELDMWEFNEGALAFYERAGFRTYRRLMELDTD